MAEKLKEMIDERNKETEAKDATKNSGHVS
jgi:hypothetical protein